MLSRRSSAGVAVLDGMLYVAGGNDGTSCLNSVERFNPKTNTWEGVAPMNIRRLVCTHGSFWSKTAWPNPSLSKWWQYKERSETNSTNSGWVQYKHFQCPFKPWVIIKNVFSPITSWNNVLLKFKYWTVFTLNYLLKCNREVPKSITGAPSGHLHHYRCETHKLQLNYYITHFKTLLYFMYSCILSDCFCGAF